MNMRATIEAKSDQMNADDLVGGPRDIKITEVRFVQSDQPVSFHFDGDQGKPFKPCKTMRRLIVELWGDNHERYIGRTLRLFRDPKVKWANAEVGGVRISHASHIDSEIRTAVAISRGKRNPYVVKPLEGTPGRPQGETGGASHKPVDRDPRAVAQNMKNAMAGVEVYERLNGIINSDKWAADLAFLKGAAPDLHGEVMGSVGEARQRIDPAGQSPIDDQDQGYG